MSEKITRAYRKTRRGYVISDAMDKTIVVDFAYKVKHPMYGKIVQKHTHFVADNPENQAKKGDLVLIMETRPLSKTKRWRLVEILEKAK